MMRALLIVLVAACGGSQPPATPPPPPPSKCARVADHLLSLMTPTAQQAPTEQLDAMRKLFNDHCKTDGWSLAAQDCFLAASTREEAGERCEKLLTPEQLQTLSQGS